MSRILSNAKSNRYGATSGGFKSMGHSGSGAPSTEGLVGNKVSDNNSDKEDPFLELVL